MQSPRAVLLLTRPLAASQRFAGQLPARLRSRVDLCMSPLLDIVTIAHAVDWGDARGVIFTSANGVTVAAGLSDRRDLPCYCVGQATTRAARAQGWRAEMLGDTADALIATLSGRDVAGPLLHPGGVHRRGNIAQTLSKAGLPVRTQAIYDQVEVPLSAAARILLDGPNPVIAPVFSPRTARQFAREATGKAPLYAVALSEAVAKPLAGLGAQPVEVARTPDAGAMIEAIESLLNRMGRVETGEGGH